MGKQKGAFNHFFLLNDIWNRFMWDSDYKWSCCLGRSVDPSIWGQQTLFMSTFSIMPPPPPWHTIISQKQPELCFPLIFSAKATSWDLLSPQKSWAALIFRQMCVVGVWCRVMLWSKINLFHCCCFLHKCEPFITCITQCQGGRDTTGETIFKHKSDIFNLKVALAASWFEWQAFEYKVKLFLNVFKHKADILIWKASLWL